MNRIGVYACYDEEGIVDDYKIFLLESMKEYLSELIIVVNGFIQDNELKKLKNISEKIFIREDIGWDAGAFKDVFTGKYKDINWELWDEIVIFNDSFYGPLFSWQDVFEIMESGQSDFWGLVMREADEYAPDRIHTFFIAVKKRMFQSKEWLKFWEEFEYESVKYEGKYEPVLTHYFEERGFKSETYLKKISENKFLLKDDYHLHGYEILVKYRFPIIKWRGFSTIYYKQAELILNYVENNTNYNSKLIKDHLKRVDNRIYPFSIRKMEEFFSVYKEAYIVGHGKYGKIIQEICDLKGWKIKKFIVSNPKEENEIGFEDVILQENEGIVVALGIGTWRELEKKIVEQFPQKQLLLPIIN